MDLQTNAGKKRSVESKLPVLNRQLHSMQTKSAPSHMKQRLKTIEDNLWSAEVALSDIRMAEMVKDALKLLDVVEQQVALARAALKRRKV